MKYFVIAGTHDQYVDWKKRNHPEMLLNGEIQNLSDIVYVAGAETLKGYSNPRGIFIGTWYTRSNIKEILIQLQVSMSDGSKIHPIEKAWKYVNSEGPMNI